MLPLIKLELETAEREALLNEVLAANKQRGREKQDLDTSLATPVLFLFNDLLNAFDERKIFEYLHNLQSIPQYLNAFSEIEIITGELEQLRKEQLEGKPKNRRESVYWLMQTALRIVVSSSKVS